MKGYLLDMSMYNFYVSRARACMCVRARASARARV